MKWSVGTKIGAGFALALLILLIISAVSYRSTNNLIESAGLRQHSYLVLGQLENVSSLMKDGQRGERGYIITGEERFLEPYNASLDKIRETLKEIQKMMVDNPRQQQSLSALEPLIENELTELKKVIDIRREKGFEAAVQEVKTGLGKKAMDDIQRVIKEMVDEESQLLKHRREATEVQARHAILTIVLGIISAVIILSLAGFLITRNISRPLQKITGAAEKIAAGDLSANTFANNRKDEIGVLSHAFGTMSHSLQEKAGLAEQIAAGNLRIDVRPQSKTDRLGNSFARMVANLRDVTGEIKEGVNVLATSASEIMASISLVAASTAETATAMSQTTTTVEEVKQTAQVSNQKARSVSDSAQKVVQVSQSGKRAVGATIEGMNRIKEQMEAIAESTIRLSEQGQAIGEIITSVNDLAERSNLLAVNAAIEAAKAGEQGRGFVVVAQEIKSLAEQSKQATAQVHTILSDIQEATNAAVMATEQGSKAVEAGVKQSEEAMEAIRVLSDSISESAQAATQIAASSHQQLIGMDQVALAMENIKQASAQNASSTKQAETAAQGLHELGQKLKDLVEQYQV